MVIVEEAAEFLTAEQISDYLLKARQRELLTETERGIPGGELTDKGRAVLASPAPQRPSWTSARRTPPCAPVSRMCHRGPTGRRSAPCNPSDQPLRGGRKGTRTPDLCRVKAPERPQEPAPDGEHAGQDGYELPPDDAS